MGGSPNIKWDIMKKAQVYKGDDYNCRLCQEEKLRILEHAETNY